MDRNLLLIVAYDGTDFHGWQRQADQRTVQAELEQVLQRILRHPLRVKGASRTDAGVHARGQIATVRTSVTIPAANLRQAIGHRLPSDVALLHAADCRLAFDPSRDALEKLYRYRIYNGPQRPVADLVSRFAWHVWYHLDLERVRAAAAHMLGRHDFAALASQGSSREDTVRTVRRITVTRRAHEVVIDVLGDGFLYNQVRNMVGTLVEVARGHWPPARVVEILASRDRRQAGPTAPALGLCLQWVRYGPLVRLPDGTE